MLKWYLKITVHIIRYPRRTLDVFLEEIGSSESLSMSMRYGTFWVLGWKHLAIKYLAYTVFPKYRIYFLCLMIVTTLKLHSTTYYIQAILSVACILICWLQTVLCLKNGLKCSFWCSFYRFSFLTIINAHLFLINLQTMMSLVCLRIILMTSYTF